MSSKVRVFANGCFDLLHYGHIILLKGAAVLGEELIVGLNSDKSIRELKGDNRPVFPQEQRLEMLQAIRYVDDVLPFDTERDLELLIRFVKPDIMVKGPDWDGKKLTGQDVLESYGGRVEIVPVKVDSTTSIIERLRK